MNRTGPGLFLILDQYRAAWSGLLLAVALSLCLGALAQSALAEDAQIITVVDTGKPDAAKADELKDLANWSLAESSKNQGYVSSTSRNKKGDVVVCIESTDKTAKLVSEHVACEGLVETEVSAIPYRDDKQPSAVVYEASAIVRDPETNNAWFNLLVDGNTAAGFPWGPIVTKEATGAGHSIGIGASASKIKLQFQLNGLGKANLTLISLGRRQRLPALQYQSKPTNLDFSSRDLAGWQTRSAGPESTLYATVFKEEHGSRLAELSHKKGQLHEALFEQTVAAEKLRGKKVTIDADCRTDSKDTDACIFILSGSGGQLAPDFWDAFVAISRNYFSKQVNDDAWRHYRVSTEIGNDCKRLEFGVKLSGSGYVQIKNVELSNASEKDPGNQPSAKLTDEQLNNLIRFARAYGYLRYFYPRTNLSTDSWNRYLLWAVDKLLANEKTHRDGTSRLQALLLPVAPELVLEKAVAQEKYLSPQATGAPFWKYIGYGADKGPFNPQSRSALVHAAGKNPPNAAWAKSKTTKKCGPFMIASDLCLSWSETNPWQTNSTLAPECRNYINTKPRSWAPSGNDRVTRLATVIALWNIPRFFYPEQDALVAWNETLAPSLQSASTDPGEAAFVRTLQKLTAPLKDDQCRIFNNNIDGLGLVSTLYAPDLSWQFLDQKLIITSNPHAMSPSRPVGRSVFTANDFPLPALLSSEKPCISAGTERRLMHRLSQNILHGPPGSRFEVSWQTEQGGRSGESAARSVPLVTSATCEGITANEVTEKRPDSFAELQPDIIYVDLTRISSGELQEKIPAISKAAKIIFDCRGCLARGNESVFEHLFKEPPALPQLKLPIICGPAESDRSFVDAGFAISIRQPCITGKAVFLVDERSVGKMELYLAAAEAAQVGSFVGSRTAGTAGNVDIAQLPAGYFLSWTATRTLKPDGSKLNTHGITPSLEIRPTQAGLREFRDELLEAALAGLK